MERERPEYLPPIERRRREFPWLAVLAIALVTLLAGGVHMLTKTHAAWNERFSDSRPVPAAANGGAQAVPDPQLTTQLAEIRRKRAQAELEAKAADNQQRLEKSQLRCINGVPFRRIPGGWENLPGESC